MKTENILGCIIFSTGYTWASRKRINQHFGVQPSLCETMQWRVWGYTGVIRWPITIEFDVRLGNEINSSRDPSVNSRKHMFSILLFVQPVPVDVTVWVKYLVVDLPSSPVHQRFSYSNPGQLVFAPDHSVLDRIHQRIYGFIKS